MGVGRNSYQNILEFKICLNNKNLKINDWKTKERI